MKIAIVKLSALGDIVHSMIVLQFIKKQYPKSEIDWFVEKRFKGILENNPHIDQVQQINLKSAKESKSFFLFWKELRKIRKLGKYDLVIDMQGLIKSALVSRLMISPVTLGFNRFSIREGIASIFYNKTFNYGYDENVIERNIALIEFALGLNVSKQEIEHKLPFLHSSQKHLNTNLSNTIEDAKPEDEEEDPENQDVNPFAIKVMAEIGIDISNQYPKLIEDIKIDELDIIMTVCSDAEKNCPIILGFNGITGTSRIAVARHPFCPTFDNNIVPKP